MVDFNDVLTVEGLIISFASHAQLIIDVWKVCTYDSNNNQFDEGNVCLSNFIPRAFVLEEKDTRPIYIW